MNSNQEQDVPDQDVYRGKTRTYSIREPRWRDTIAIFSELAKSVQRFVTVNESGAVEFDQSGIAAVVFDFGALGGFIASKAVVDLKEEEFNELPAAEAAGLLARVVAMTFTPELLGNVASIVTAVRPAVRGAAMKSAEAKA